MRKIIPSHAPLLCLLLASLPLFADQTKEEPVGMVLSPGGAKMLRANTETPLDARAGDLLFTGDGLRTAAGPASFLFCPAKAMDTLSPSGEVHFDAKTPKVKTGKITEAPARACVLPATLRVASASQQHYGVSMTRGVSDYPPTPRDKLPADVLTELAPVDAALTADPNDAASLIAEANIFENHKLLANAVVSYQKLRPVLQDPDWVKGKLFELNDALGSQQAAAVAGAAGPGGKTYALLVGISKYKLPDLALQFADKDADDFAKLVETPRVGGLPADDVMLLTDEKATAAAVRLGFENFLKRKAGKNDTVIILLAGHGTVELPGSKGAYVLTYDSDPQDLKSTALAMSDIAALFTDQLAKVGRVLLFVDVCKAGTIGTIKANTSVNSEVQNLGDIDGQLLGLLASRPKELSLEGPQFGGGHGAFTYAVLKGLSGDADANKDGVVDANELINYVQNQVKSTTEDKQHPREFGTYDNSLRLADLKKPGMQMSHFQMIYDSRNGGPLTLASASPEPPLFDPEATQDIDDYNAALKAGRLLPEQPNNAYDALQKLKPLLSRDQYIDHENELRVALENKAQEVLLRYLAGEENPQTQQEFSSGAHYMEVARKLTPESLFLEGRQDFFQGRSLLFEKKFPQAASLLEDAVRIDPGAAYGYNALGIAYLEQAQFDKAIPALRDASHRAVHWSYPLHNLALAYVENGDYKSAIKAYQAAEKLTPQYSYLPYNLGLVYQRLNRRKEAEASYKRAIDLEPNTAPPYNALGTLKASEGKRGEAEQLYKESLAKDPSLLPARHNLALLLAAEKNRQQEAIDLWRENLKLSPDYIPSRLSLAQMLADRGDNAGAIQEYRQVLVSKPQYIAARVALAGLLTKSGDSAGALEQLREASKQDPANGEILEQLGDVEAAQHNAAEARADYQAALQQAPDRAAHKRIENKIKSIQ